jgi:hypothetical protein
VVTSTTLLSRELFIWFLSPQAVLIDISLLIDVFSCVVLARQGGLLMPVTEASREVSQLSASSSMQSVSLQSTSPRSILRHRSISSDIAAKELPRVPRASRTQTLTQTQKPGPKAPKPTPSAVAQPVTESHSQPRQHWLVLLGLGMMIALALVLVGQLATSWLMTTWDDLHYGRPRTFQVDAYVGHESGKISSHFIALNIQGRLEVIELPGGDAAHAHIYLGPQLIGPNADLVPATIHFVDTRHDHHPDMLVQAGDIQVIFRNANGTFAPV